MHFFKVEPSTFFRTAAALCLVTILGISFFCRNVDSNAAAGQKTPPSPVNELTWKYRDTAFGPSQVVVTVPKTASAQNRMPVLIALHGQGESRKKPSLGARGWPDDYKMLRAFRRLAAPPLRAADFGKMVTAERLDMLNATLKKQPYRGIIVVCPYLPDRFRADTLYKEAAEYGDFLINTVLPRVYKETPALGTASSTGIDGVSLGGRVSVTVGLTHPETFGAVGGIQAAFRQSQAKEIAGAAARAKAHNPNIRLRIMSSEKDRFLKVTRLLSTELTKQGVPHRTDIVKGNHSYEFNRGPGVYEMLIYYDKILRGEPFP
jgi:iron(III)-salmochelin esterase